ncbi:hypothetical protein Tco_0462154 [Tanacetum coccineum]
MALPPRDQRHQYLRYEGLQYTYADIADFEMRLARIYRREVHRVQVFYFGGLPDLMAEGLSARMLIKHRDAQGMSLFTSRAWRRLFDIKRPLVHELILEFFSTFRFREAILDLDTPGALQISSAGDFLGTTPSYTVIMDPILRLYHRLIACSISGRSQAPEKVTVTDLFYLRGMDVGSVNVPYILARYLRLFAARRKSGVLIYGGQFMALLAKNFGLLTEEGIYVDIDDTWAWVAMGLERQPDVTAGSPGVAEDAPTVNEGDQAIPTPMQVPQQPPLPPLATGRTMPQRLGRLKEEHSRDASGGGLARPAPPQPSRTLNSQTHDPPILIFLITEYLVNISKWRAFWSVNEDILEDYYSEDQYAVSIKEDTAYPCLHSPKTTKETSSIRRIQRRPIRRIEDIVCEYSGRYQTWSLLQETPIRRIQSLGYAVSNRLPDSINRKLKNEF